MLEPYVDADNIDNLSAISAIERHKGFGVLFLKNLNESNVNLLPANFLYNLVRSHSFGRLSLERTWLVVIEKGPKVDLDAGSGAKAYFDGNQYRGISVKRYLDTMRRKGRIVEASTPETTFTSGKEIDWEERHFQICLALISRTEMPTPGMTDFVNPKDIIKQADSMVEALKKHHSQQ